jgi:uncharacterized protein YggE
MRHSILALLLVFNAVGATFAQDIQVNRQNKTIAVTAEDSVTADAEVAVLEIGYHNYALTQDAAFQENVRVADQITKALLAAGIPKANIETDKLRLQRAQAEDKWTPEMKKDRQFEAQQSWSVTVSVSQAQAIVGLAVRSGANDVEDVEWNVVDPVGLQAKAGGAALAKAHAIAEQMAKGLGAKLGELVYASNHAQVPKLWRNMTVQTSMATLGGMMRKEPELTLFPQKIKSDATIYAVFAIE